MRIKVEIVVELTEEQRLALAREYGFSPDPATTREFVRTYITAYAEMDGSPGSDFWTVKK